MPAAVGVCGMGGPTLTRPDSYRHEYFTQRCGNCQHCIFLAEVHDGMCIRGDGDRVQVLKTLPNGNSTVRFDGSDLDDIRQSEPRRFYKEIFDVREVDSAGLCDQWERRKVDW